MRDRKLRRRIEAEYGRAADIEYFPGDMEGIRTYHEYRLRNELDPFTVDDTTWRDLSMDAVFRHVNAARSTSGEQVLYHLLRCPAVDRPTYDGRRTLIERMENEPALRLSLSVILAKLGKRRAANTSEAFHPSGRTDRRLALAPLLVLALVASLIGAMFSKAFLPPLLLLALICPFYHMIESTRLSAKMDIAAYSVGIVAACRRVEKLRDPALAVQLRPMFDAARRARPVTRIGGAATLGDSDLAKLFSSLFLIDLLLHRALLRRLARHRDDVFMIHEHLGRIDAVIAIASYRQSARWCAPELDFSDEATPWLRADGLTHPLLTDPVPNDVSLDGPLLVTGSNASGKSTFLKSAALAALLAQSVCTAPCGAYAASAFHIYTSMAITDSVQDGDSYFIAEIKSIKRIVDATAAGERVLCAIDEVLRGTNTVERVAASTELLRLLAAPRALCLAATHDIELCRLLADAYRMVHFEEQICEGDVTFDFMLRDGPATTRNAIRLLAAMGFDPAMIARATESAEAFLRNGRWPEENDAAGGAMP